MSSVNAETDPWLGRQMGDRDRYCLEKALGGGGMGDVYLATDRVLGKKVALKLLKAGLIENSDLRRRFDREITISAALGSEHIVQVTDHGITTEGNPFFVMEYLKGQSLGQVLKKHKRLTFGRTVRIILQVCTGLQVAHRGVQLLREGSNSGDLIKVIHRDLKPDNIFLIPHDIWGELVKILDFGIAKIRSEQLTEINATVNGSFLGTMRYAAPEQWQGKQDIDVRADLYSLGILFYEMLTGTDPFGLQSHQRAIHPTGWMAAHITTEARPIYVQPDCQSIPPDINDIVLRCLAKDPQQRFRDAGELQAALQAVVPGSILRGGNQAERTEVNRGLKTSVLETPAAADSTDVITPAAATQAITQAQAPFQNPTTPIFSTTDVSPLSPAVTPPPVIPSTLGKKRIPWLLVGVVAVGSLISAGIYWQATQQPDLTPAPTTEPTTPPREVTTTAAPSPPSTPASVLNDALAAANADNVTLALTLARRILPEDLDYDAAQALIAAWSLELAQERIASGEYDQALSFLNGIPDNQAETNPGQTLATAVEGLLEAQQLSQDGLLREAIAMAYVLPSQGPLAAAADELVCSSLVTLLERDFRREVDLAFGGEDPPLFDTYELTGCRTTPLQIRTNLARMENREDDNFKVIALVMGGFVWESLPALAHERLSRGELIVRFMETGSQVAQVTFTNPSLIPETNSDIEAVFASLRFQRL